MTRSVRDQLGLALLAALAAGGAARAQEPVWREFSYPDAGFSAQFPAAPVVTAGVYRTTTGAAAPAHTYDVRQGDLDYRITVADFSALDMAPGVAIDDAVKALGQAGDIKLDVRERIDRQFGRELRVQARDGGVTVAAIFFVDRKLYVLSGQAPATDPDAGSAQSLRFQQSLQFVDQDGRPPRRPEDGPPGSGLGPGRRADGRPRRPPPQAFADCRGKSEGAPVQHQTPEGLVAATCVATPEGLAARPDGGPPGPPDGPPDDGPGGPPA